MLSKPSWNTAPLHQFLASKLRDWTPPDGLAVDTWSIQPGKFAFRVEIVLRCCCELRENLTLALLISRDLLADSQCRNAMIEDMFRAMYLEAEQQIAKHVEAQA